MTEPADRNNPIEIVGHLVEKAVTDELYMDALKDRLTAARDAFNTKNDGGLDGALSWAEAIQDFFAERRPDWVRAGILHPMDQIVLTLRALKEGGTSSILKANRHKIRNQPRTTEELVVRGVVSALVDLIIDRRSCSLDQACADVASRLRKRGFPLGRGATEHADAITVKSWRKQTMGGAKSDPDTEMYLQTKECLFAQSESLDFVIEDALDSLRGFLPPGT